MFYVPQLTINLKSSKDKSPPQPYSPSQAEENSQREASISAVRSSGLGCSSDICINPYGAAQLFFHTNQPGAESPGTVLSDNGYQMGAICYSCYLLPYQNSPGHENDFFPPQMLSIEGYFVDVLIIIP